VPQPVPRQAGADPSPQWLEGNASQGPGADYCAVVPILARSPVMLEYRLTMP
jgi:hypothetical protein